MIIHVPIPDDNFGCPIAKISSPITGLYVAISSEEWSSGFLVCITAIFKFAFESIILPSMKLGSRFSESFNGKRRIVSVLDYQKL